MGFVPPVRGDEQASGGDAHHCPRSRGCRHTGRSQHGPGKECDAHGACGAHGLYQRWDRDGDGDKTRGRVRAWRHRGRAERLEGDAAPTAGLCSSRPAHQNKGCAAQPAWQKPSGGPRCTGSPQYRRVAFSSSPPTTTPVPALPWGWSGNGCNRGAKLCRRASQQWGNREGKRNYRKKKKRGEERVRGERKREREGGEWRAGTDPAPWPGPGGTQGVEPPPRLPPTSFRFPIKS